MLKLSKNIKILEENGLIYNNIKMKNILLDDNDEILIVDNLKYMLLKDKERYLKQDMEEMMYLSPEMLKSEEVTIKSDIWNIGIIYYKLLTKENPFETKSLCDLIKSITEFRYNNNTKINEKYNLLISKLLKVNKEHRLSIDDLINEIELIDNENKLNEMKELINNKENEKVYICI